MFTDGEQVTNMCGEVRAFLGDQAVATSTDVGHAQADGVIAVRIGSHIIIECRLGGFRIDGVIGGIGIVHIPDIGTRLDICQVTYLCRMKL